MLSTWVISSDRLISDLAELTGVPLLLNTSFNENEPVVRTPGHAIDCFLKTRMDALYIGNYAVRQNRSRGDQDEDFGNGRRRFHRLASL